MLTPAILADNLIKTIAESGIAQGRLIAVLRLQFAPPDNLMPQTVDLAMPAASGLPIAPAMETQIMLPNGAPVNKGVQLQFILPVYLRQPSNPLAALLTENQQSFLGPKQLAMTKYIFAPEL